MEVLQKCLAQHVVVGGVAHDCRNAVETRLLRRTPATLTSDEFVVRSLALATTNDDRLEESDLLDRMHELCERVGVEDLTGLARIGDDVVGGDLDVDGTRDGFGRMGLCAGGGRLPRSCATTLGGRALGGSCLTTCPLSRGRLGGDQGAQTSTESTLRLSHGSLPW